MSEFLTFALSLAFIVLVTVGVIRLTYWLERRGFFD